MNKLKPCPFCGGEAKIFAFYDGGICVKCMDCFCQTEARTDSCISDAQKFNAFEKVVEAWNRRTNDANNLYMP